MGGESRDGVAMPGKLYANNLTSSWLVSAEYDPEREQLDVTTRNGGTYTFHRVPQNIFEEFRDASSAGAFFHEVLKARYT